jgi:hypothetical protein
MCGGPSLLRSGRPADQPAIDLDHIGLGLDDVEPALRTAVGRLGATVLWGGVISGCRYVTTRVGDAARGMDLEFLEPRDDDDDPFLQRFLDRDGPGPHHLTFVVRDLDAVIARLGEAGLAPALVRRHDPRWHEAFYAGARMGGIVVQVAQATGRRTDAGFAQARRDEWRGPGTTRRRGWHPGEEGWWAWPGPRGPLTAYLVTVVMAIDDLDAACHVYGELLDGAILERTPATAELEWPRGGRLRFEQVAEGTPGRVRLEIAEAPVALEELGGAMIVRPPA